MSQVPQGNEALAALERLYAKKVIALEEGRAAARLIARDDAYEFPQPAPAPAPAPALAPAPAPTPAPAPSSEPEARPAEGPGPEPEPRERAATEGSSPG